MPMLMPIGDLLPADVEGRRHRLDQPPGERRRRFRLLAGRRNDGELVAAHARDEGAGRGGFQALGDRAEKLVADRVAEEVVGLLEMVEVDARARRSSCRRASASVERLVQALGERGAVGQIGQRIMVREMGDVFVPGEELRAGRLHLAARFVRGRGRLP